MRGDRIKYLREQVGYTQEDLSAMLDLGSKEIWRYENNKTVPKADTLGVIAKFFNVTSDYLLGLSDDPKETITEHDLSDIERHLIDAFRRGDLRGALKVIANNE
jgi:transcriptional regulator with XRE-family HTH domain